MVPLSLPFPPLETIFIRADHPFIFFIYDFETSQVLFIGRITDPRPESSAPPSLSIMKTWPHSMPSAFPHRQSWPQRGSSAPAVPSMNPSRTETETGDIGALRYYAGEPNNRRTPSRSQSVSPSSSFPPNPYADYLNQRLLGSQQYMPYMHHAPQMPQLVYLNTRVYRSPFNPDFQRRNMPKQRYY